VLIAVASAARRASVLADAAAWLGDVPPVIACLLIDVLDRLDSFDSDLVTDADVQAALLARLHDDLHGSAWANLLAGAMRRSR
jgi:hypothetical protein